MKKLKRILRLVALILVMIMASIIPLPVGLYQRDIPKEKTEQIDPDDID